MRFTPKLPPEDSIITEHNSIREFLVDIIYLIAICAGAYFVLGLLVSPVAKLISPETERKIFSTFALNIPGGTSDHAKKVEAFLSRKVMEASKILWEKGASFRVIVIDEDEENALAFPGGTIAVTSALIKNSQSENELMMVLGHELGHFYNRDHLTSLGRAFIFGTLASFLGLEGGAQQIFSLTTNLEALSFSRYQETQADIVGIDLLQKMYGHVGGYSKFFERMSDIDAPRVGQYFYTHPMSDDRISLLKQWIQSHHSDERPLLLLPKEIGDVTLPEDD